MLLGFEAQIGYVLQCLERCVEIPEFDLLCKDRSPENYSVAGALVMGGGEVADYRIYALKLSKEGRVLKAEVFEFVDYSSEEESGDLDEVLNCFKMDIVSKIQGSWLD